MNSAFLQLLDGASLYSDRTTRDGTFLGKFEYPTNFNKIISPNKKAIAILLQNGNFQILTGEFNAAGEPKRDDGTFESDPLRAYLYTTVKYDLFKKTITGSNTGFVGTDVQTYSNTGFLPPVSGTPKVIGGATGIEKAPFELVFSSTDGFYIKSYYSGLMYRFDVTNLVGLQLAPEDKFKLYLVDNGDLRIDAGKENIWSSITGNRDIPKINKLPEEVTGNSNNNQQQQSQQAQQAQQGRGNTQPPKGKNTGTTTGTTTVPNMLSSPILLIAAAAAAFLYLRK